MIKAFKIFADSSFAPWNYHPIRAEYDFQQGTVVDEVHEVTSEESLLIGDY